MRHCVQTRCARQHNAVDDAGREVHGQEVIAQRGENNAKAAGHTAAYAGGYIGRDEHLEHLRTRNMLERLDSQAKALRGRNDLAVARHKGHRQQHTEAGFHALAKGDGKAADMLVKQRPGHHGAQHQGNSRRNLKGVHGNQYHHRRHQSRQQADAIGGIRFHLNILGGHRRTLRQEMLAVPFGPAQAKPHIADAQNGNLHTHENA